MENKYYTPTIEEFHVGFEYEYFDSIYSRWRTYILYEEYTLPTQDMLEDYNPFWQTKNLSSFRVKYLDREDIESLGLKFDDIRCDDNYNEWECYFSISNEIKFGISVKKSEEDIPYISIYPDHKTSEHLIFRFTGYIKNKSELKKLMKQLGIWEK